MQKTEISQLDPDTFKVTVVDKSSTTHIVTVTDDHLQSLTGGKMTKEELVRFSFEFLLEREPNTSILPEFEITVIGRYFPEYQEMVRR